jgi:hypothetical protein
MATALSKLTDQPAHFSDCCAGLSWPLLETLASRLPQSPALVLSIGSGSGLLEGLLLEATEGELNVYGVEVPPCVNKHLPEGRLLRVPCTASLHPDALLASALIFVYPRKASLVANYIDSFADGAVEQVVWLGHRSDLPEIQQILESAFYKMELVEGPGLSSYELLVIASLPQQRWQRR